MSHPAPLLGLDPPRSQAVPAPPFLERLSQPDDVKERPLPRHAANRRAGVVIEVAVHGDPARFRKSDRLFDLAPLEIPFPQRIAAHHGACTWSGILASAQMALKVHRVHGRSACSGPRAKSPARIFDVAATILASTAASSGVTSIRCPRRMSNRTRRGSVPPGSSPRRAANP